MIVKVINKVSDKPANTERIRDLFDLCLDRGDFGGIVLVKPDDTPCGYLFTQLTELYFEAKKVSICLSIWVEEEFRSHSLSMLDALERWSKYKQADVIIMSEFTGLSPKNTGKLYERLGFNLTEKQYWKELK